MKKYLLPVFLLSQSFFAYGEPKCASKLLDAVKDKNINKAQKLLQKGANPNASNSCPGVLYYALNSPEMVALLLNYKADPNENEVLGRCIRGYGIIAGSYVNISDYRACTLLLQAGANPNNSFQGETLVRVAIQSSYNPKDKVKALLESGAVVNFDDLSYALTNIATPSYKDQFASFTDLDQTLAGPILRAINPSQSDPSGNTFLNYWLAKGFPDISFKSALKLLIKSGVNVRDVDSHGRNPLTFVDNGSPDDPGSKIKVLIAAGADVTHQDNEGKTPLMWGYINRQVFTKFYQAFIDNGADVNIKDTFGRTALMYAAIAHLPIYSGGRHWYALQLINAGANVNAQDNRGKTALMYESVTEDDGYIVEYDSLFVDELINAGADVNKQDLLGRSALHYAAIAGKMSAIKAFIEAGGKSLRDKEGKLPSDVATKNYIADQLKKMGF